MHLKFKSIVSTYYLLHKTIFYLSFPIEVLMITIRDKIV